MPEQAFIYLLVAFWMTFFLHQHSEWKKSGSPSSSHLSIRSIKQIVFYSALFWIAVIVLAAMYRDGLAGSALHLISYLVAALLANAGLLLMKCRREADI